MGLENVVVACFELCLYDSYIELLPRSRETFSIWTSVSKSSSASRSLKWGGGSNGTVVS